MTHIRDKILLARFGGLLIPEPFEICNIFADFSTRNSNFSASSIHVTFIIFKFWLVNFWPVTIIFMIETTDWCIEISCSDWMISSELAISSKALGFRSANSAILMTSLKIGIFCEPMSDEMMKSALYRSGVHDKYCALGKIIGSKFCVTSATFVTSSVSILISVSNLMTSEVRKSPSWTQFSVKVFRVMLPTRPLIGSQKLRLISKFIIKAKSNECKNCFLRRCGLSISFTW